jgi:hypothetical protein
MGLVNLAFQAMPVLAAVLVAAAGRREREAARYRDREARPVLSEPGLGG